MEGRGQERREERERRGSQAVVKNEQPLTSSQLEDRQERDVKCSWRWGGEGRNAWKEKGARGKGRKEEGREE